MQALCDGREGDFYSIASADCEHTLIQEKELVMVRQQQVCDPRIVLGNPRGLIDLGESPIEAGSRTT